MYDYVVVGAGAAGCALAARLTQDPGTRVLLLEAGGRGGGLDVTVPAAFAKLFRGPGDWAYETAPQPGLAGRRLFWPRGRMLGGSTAMNAQMWVPGARTDLDAWGDDGPLPGWGWAEVGPALERARATVDVADGLADPNPLTRSFLEAAGHAGIAAAQGESRVDGPTPAGAALSPVTQRAGRRRGAVDAYLRPALGRPNLEVRTGVHVRRVLVEQGVTVGVETLSGEVLRARRDVVLAGGAVNTPHLLQLSGIGDPEVLSAAGIPCVHALPGVGQGLADHLMAITVRLTEVPVSLATAASLRNVVRWLARHRGPLASNVAEALALVSSDPVAGRTVPDVELVFAPVPYLDHGATTPPGHGYSVGAVLLAPRSRGSVRAASADPGRHPVVDPAYLSDPDGADLATLVRGVRLAARVLDAPAFAPYAARPLRPGPEDPAAARHPSDDDVAAFVRDQAETIYHPTGTCRMGTGRGAVVDPGLRVHGVRGLRVVDASVIPAPLHGHPQAMTYAVAERAATLLAGQPEVERVEVRS